MVSAFFSRLAGILLDVTPEQRERRGKQALPMRVFDWVIDGSAFAGAVLVLFMALSIGLNVLLRRVFQAPLVWALPTTEFALLFITFLAAPVVLRREGHVRMTAITELLGPSARMWFYIAGSTIGAAVSLLLAWQTVNSTIDQAQSGAVLLQGIEVKKALITWVIPYGFTLLGLQFARQGINALRTKSRGSAGSPAGPSRRNSGGTAGFEEGV